MAVYEEHRKGRLFDLAPDGLGFIDDDADHRVWAFRYQVEGRSLAVDIAEFVRLEGKWVAFVVVASRIVSLMVVSQAIKAKSMTAGA